MSPSDDNMRGGLPGPGQQPQAGPGGGYPAAPPPQPDPQAQRTAMAVADIVRASRQLAMMYPQASSELRDINNLMTKVQQKIVNAKPAPEPSAPPV